MMNTLAAIGLIWASHFYVNMAFMIMLLSTIGLMNIIISISGDTFTTRHKLVRKAKVENSQKYSCYFKGNGY